MIVILFYRWNNYCTLSISPPRFFSAQKKTTTSTWRGEVKGSQQKFKDSKGIGPYPGGFLPIPIPPLRDFSSFWGAASMVTYRWFPLPIFQHSIHKQTNLVDLWLWQSPKFWSEKWGRGIFAICLWSAGLLPVYSVLYSKMFKIFAVLQTSQEVLRTPNKNHQNSNALPNTGHNITIKRS